MYLQRKSILQQLEQQFATKLLLYVTSSRPNLETNIADDVIDHLLQHLETNADYQRLGLIIDSNGGNTLAAWRIINLLHQYCDELLIIIAGKALSAATLIALGGNQIVMTKQATLGPIDPSINSPLNPQLQGQNQAIPVSVEAINGFLQLIKQQGINDSQAKAQVLMHLSEKVHPLVLGEAFRRQTQIRMLASKLLSQQLQDQPQIQQILDFLCNESGSHDYTINSHEAKLLGLNIITPDITQTQLINQLYQDFASELEFYNPFVPQQFLAKQTDKTYQFKRGLIESQHFGSHVFISHGRYFYQSQKNQPQQLQHQLYSEGWQRYPAK